MGWYSWRPYVSVAARRRHAAKRVAKMKKAGREISPIEIVGRKIATTFWGDAWCKNLESYSDYSNRLPRGRTYVHNGSVIDLQIEAGRVRSLVSGSDIYEVDTQIKSLAKKPLDRHQGPMCRQNRLAGRAAAGLHLHGRDGDRDLQGRGIVSCPSGDLAELLVPRLGDHVQARGGDALRRRRTPRPRAGAAVHLARNYTKLDFSPAHKIHKIHALRMVSASSALSSCFCYRGLVSVGLRVPANTIASNKDVG